MIDKMQASGSIHPSHSRNSFRKRVFDSALQLGAGRSAAARLAVAVSELFLAQGAERTLHWSCGINSADDRKELHFHFEPPGTEGLTQRIRSHVHRIRSDEKGLDMWIQLPAQPSEDAWKKARQRLCEPSRDELLGELSQANAALDQHLAELESLVEERTRALQVATTEAREQADNRAALNRLLNESLMAKSAPDLLECALDIILEQPFLKVRSRAGAFLAEGPDGPLRLVVSRDLSPELLTLCDRVPLGRCLCGRAAECREIVHASCVDERHEIRFEGMQPHGHYSVPIVGDQGTLGVMVFYLPHGTECREEEIKFLKAASDVVGIGLQRIAADRGLKDAVAEARCANEAKSMFLASMSHEIRTPMNSIINMSELVLETPLNSRQRRYLKSVNSAAGHLLALINDILDFSKIEAGHMTLEEVSFSLDELLEEVVETFRAKVIETGVELVVHRRPEVPDRLRCDSTRLKQVLVNLVGNALKFTERGEVVLRVENAPTEDDGESRLQFSVKDTGIGLTPEQQGRLFQAFSQADASTTRRYGGTGLGLAICQRLVGFMGGRIWVESEPGHGSTFIFTLHAQMEANDVPMPVPDSLRGLHAVVVEDNRSTQELLQTLLEQMGVGCQVFANAGDFITWIENAPQSGEGLFFLIDWRLPDRDGVELIRWLRGLPEHAKTPAILASSFLSDDDEVHSMGAGVSCCLQKPVTAPLLLEAILNANRLEHEVRQFNDARVNATDSPALGGRRLLIAEDNSSNQMVLSELLDPSGAELAFAGNGHEAVNLFMKGGFDLILMDMQMPVMDGMEATRRIRSLPGGEIPIIALTANATAQDREQCLAAGMNDFLTKPIVRTQLFATLSQRLSSNELVTQAQCVEEEAVDSQPEVPGWERAEAAVRLGVPLGSIIKMTRKFMLDLVDLRNDLSASYLEKRIPDMRRHAHTIAGAGAQFGLRTLSELARELEKIEDPGSGEAAALLEQILAMSADLIDSIAPQNPVPGPMTADVSECDDLNVPDGLLEALEIGDAREAKELLKEARGPFIAELSAAIENYDFDTAINLLTEAQP